MMDNFGLQLPILEVSNALYYWSAKGILYMKSSIIGVPREFCLGNPRINPRVIF